MIGALAAAMFDLRSRQENPGPKSDPRPGRDRQRPGERGAMREKLRKIWNRSQIWGKWRWEVKEERDSFFFLFWKWEMTKQRSNRSHSSNIRGENQMRRRATSAWAVRCAFAEVTGSGRVCNRVNQRVGFCHETLLLGILCGMFWAMVTVSMMGSSLYIKFLFYILILFCHMKIY